MPVGLVLDHGVEGDEEFTSDGNVDHFSRFASGQETIVEGGDARVAAPRVPSGDEQGASHARAATADGSASTVLAGVAGTRSKTGEACGLTCVETPEFGEFGGQQPSRFDRCREQFVGGV